MRLLQLGFDIETEKEITIDKFLTKIDLYIESCKTVIEIQGPYHFKLVKHLILFFIYLTFYLG